MKNKKKSKGERLGWQKLEDVKPIRLTLELIKGNQVFKNNIMEIGQKVKVVGFKELGTITEKKEERIGSSTAKVIYTVTFDNQKSFEFMRDELRNA